MNYSDDHDIRAGFAVQQQIVPNGKVANTGPEIVADASGPRMVCQQVEPLTQELEHPISDFDISRFVEEIERDVWRSASASGARRYATSECLWASLPQQSAGEGVPGVRQ